MNDPTKAIAYQFKTNSALQKFLHIDPKLSQILDDAVQKDFLVYLSKVINNMKDSDQLINLSQQLRKYLNQIKMGPKAQNKIVPQRQNINMNTNQLKKLIKQIGQQIANDQSKQQEQPKQQSNITPNKKQYSSFDSIVKLKGN